MATIRHGLAMRDNDLSKTSSAERQRLLRHVAATAGVSRYGQIAAQLREKIVSGAWMPSECIPSEGALAKEFDTALGTMRQAIAVLVQEGLLERLHGKGTFVASGMSGASLMRFFRFGSRDGSAAHGADEAAPRSEILSCRRTHLDDDIAAKFGLPPRAWGVFIARRRWLDDRPRLLESIWLPLPRCQELLQIPTSQWGDLLYPLLNHACGITVHRASDEVTFRTLKADEAKLLELPNEHPCALVTRLAYDIQGNCVEFRLTRGDAFEFRYAAEIR